MRVGLEGMEWKGKMKGRGREGRRIVSEDWWPLN
jgi:hypothetical protein